MEKKMEDSKGNLVAQKKQVKLEISELEDALSARRIILWKVEGALELIDGLDSENKNSKKEKQNA